MTQLYYVEINVICILLLIGIRAVLSNGIGVIPARRQAFSRLLFFMMLFCIADLVGGVCGEESFQGVGLVLEICYLCCFVFLLAVAFSWMIYVNIRLFGLDVKRKKRLRICAIPAILVCIMFLTNPWTHWTFRIDDGKYVREFGFYIHCVVMWTYLLIPTVQTFVALHRETSGIRRKKMLPMFLFAVPSAIAAVFQIAFTNISVTQVGVTLSALAVAINWLMDQISTDELTGLNNRRQLRSYVEEQLQEETDLFVMMLDLNSFKEINDTYGHLVGDRAICDVADALRSACSKMPHRVFLCRYGGDEFVVTGEYRSREEIEWFKTQIREQLSLKNTGEQSYLLDISIGSADGTCSDTDDFEHLLRAADEAMYVDKKHQKLLQSPKREKHS